MPEHKKELDNRGKWLISLWSALVFLVIAAPFTYKLVNIFTSLIGLDIATNDGCPNIYGLVLHALVFTLIVRAMMEVKLPGLE